MHVMRVMRVMRAWLLTISLVGFTVVAAPALDAARAPAVDANGQLQDPALQARFEDIAKNLRCLVCQNESVADSNAQLAGDLRRQVREMLVAGKSDDDIFKFMTDRYGDFVRFNPPLEPKTLLIWGAPFLMLLLGGFIVMRIARQRAHMPLDE
jgi:cytochrome c-type biogenesis protein CcmH